LSLSCFAYFAVFISGHRYIAVFYLTTVMPYCP
jgi:hypothetical protein